jgi:hypothetical protein
VDIINQFLVGGWTKGRSVVTIARNSSINLPSPIQEMERINEYWEKPNTVPAVPLSNNQCRHLQIMINPVQVSSSLESLHKCVATSGH